MKFSKSLWGNYTLELLPRLSFYNQGECTTYRNDTKELEDGWLARKRSTPITITKEKRLTLQWLYCALSVSWEDRKLLTEEESVAYEARYKS